ncbi:MAG: class I SAM-dependent methyltransferase [Mycobacterium sp.]|nr:class I SAM-dependent methyltransferase [Mycobacterium sp.]
MIPEPSDAHTAWEEHYTAKPQVWSGCVNVQLAELVGQLNGKRALDLGCGEGADAIWLAERGWTVVAVDVSTTALSRARAAAESRGIADRIDFQQHDLTAGFPPGIFDLVSVQFLHSTVEMDRTALLRSAAAVVAPGGTFLIVDHAAAPPWASKMHHHEFPTAETVLSGLELDDRQWQRVQVGSVERLAHGPDGQDATLVDNVIRLRRNSGQGSPRPTKNG